MFGTIGDVITILVFSAKFPKTMAVRVTRKFKKSVNSIDEAHEGDWIVLSTRCSCLGW